MKQILKILTVSFILQLTLSSCRASYVEKNKVLGIVQEKQKTETKQNYNDVNDLRGCQVDYELGSWRKSKVFDGVWQRYNASIDNGIVYEGESYLDSDNKINSTELSNNGKFHIIYIGPWRTATLTHYEGLFLNRKKITEERQIRFVAYQSIDYKNPPELNYHGTMRYQFESMTEENKKISERSLSLLPSVIPNEFDLCVIKWNAKFGYNAVAEVKSKNPFSKNYLVPTGKIIEAKE